MNSNSISIFIILKSHYFELGFLYNNAENKCPGIRKCLSLNEGTLEFTTVVPLMICLWHQ